MKRAPPSATKEPRERGMNPFQEAGLTEKDFACKMNLAH